jgi:DNA (cytosine-5)-methyltransferase 1
MGRGERVYPEVFEGFMKQFYFKPEKTQRSFDLISEFRRKAQDHGWTKKEMRSAISKSVDLNNEKNFKPNRRTIDLFAGIGGLRLGFEKAGFNTVFSNDSDKRCKATYDLNFNSSKLVVEDIRYLEVEKLPEFDFLLAGFPCQAFSIAGNREGFNDKKGRGNLFFEIVRFLQKRKPEGFLLENVKNLKAHDNGKTYKIIIDTLHNLGYKTKDAVLNSMEFGNVPQNRERIYIAGFKNQEVWDAFQFPNSLPLAIKVEDLLEEDVPEKYFYNEKPLFEKIKSRIVDSGKVYQWRRKYVRENKSGVCPTLTANMGMGGHNVPIVKVDGGIRKLTPMECARIQGFPMNFKLPSWIPDSALYKQIGNSVTVTVVEAIAKKIAAALASASVARLAAGLDKDGMFL